MYKLPFLPILIVSALASGCAMTAPDRHLTTAPTTTTAPVADHPYVAPNRILVQFETIGCVCALKNVEMALLDIPSVETLDWEFDQSRVWLNFTKPARPTDEELRHALEYENVKIKQIYRP